MNDEPKPQLSYAEVVNMPPEKVVAAARNGQLRDLLAGHDPDRTPTAHDELRKRLRTMSADEIVEMRKAGELDKLLGRT